jgi:hypothetical protein
MGLGGSVPPFVELRRGPVRDFSDSLSYRRWGEYASDLCAALRAVAP